MVSIKLGNEGPSDLVSKLVLQLVESIEGKAPDLARLMRIVAIPHHFDAQILDLFVNDNNEGLSGAAALEQMKQLSVVHEVEKDRFAYHENVREVFLRLWRSDNLFDEYVKHSRTLKIHFSHKLDVNEMLYHWFIVDPQAAYIGFEIRCERFLDDYDTAEAEILIRVAQEQRWILPESQQARIELLQATLDQLHFRWQKAIKSYRTLLSDVHQSNTVHNHSLLGIGYCLNHMGKWREASELLEKVKIEFKKAMDPYLVDVYLNLGWAYFRLDQLFKSLPLLQDALDLARLLDKLSAQGWALSNLGAVYFALGEMKKSIRSYENALEIRRKIVPGGVLVGRSLLNLANVYLKLADYDSVLRYTKKALAIQQKVDDYYGESHTLQVLAVCHMKREEYKLALELFKRALVLQKEISTEAQVATTMKSIAKAYELMGEQEKAKTFFREASEIENSLATQKGDKYEIG